MDFLWNKTWVRIFLGHPVCFLRKEIFTLASSPLSKCSGCAPGYTLCTESEKKKIVKILPPPQFKIGSAVTDQNVI